MNRELADMREHYDLARLLESEAGDDPLALFDAWFAAAREAGLSEPNAMTLATVDADGAPRARVVLLKGFDARGFGFYTHFEGDKGRELAADPRAALVFLWQALHRQVRVEGRVERMADAESDAYFASRPRDSQLGAWASPQSRPLADAEELERRAADVRARFGEGEVPRPPHWGGYRLVPGVVEFWQGRPSRLHDRLRYDREGDGWRRTRLAP